MNSSNVDNKLNSKIQNQSKDTNGVIYIVDSEV